MTDFWMQKFQSLSAPPPIADFLAIVMRRVETVWQRRSKELRAVNFSLLADKQSRRGLPAQFDSLSNTVELNPYVLIATLILNNPSARFSMEQIITHEIMHAFSYRLIRRHGDRLMIFSGVSCQVGNLEATKVFCESELRLNEYVTNFYSMRTMRAATRPDAERVAVHQFLIDTYDDLLIGQIEKLVGAETLYDAYFNGQLDQMLQRMLAGGVIIEPLLAAIETQKRDETLDLCFYTK